MTNHEINIAIAEACGYTFDGDKWQRGGVRIMWQHYNRELGYSDPPDYCNDLNAMHEAEKVLIGLCKEGDFWFHLRTLLDFPDGESDWCSFYFFQAIHATARQRAEAFLRAIGKWEEDT